ncbi:MAG: hypothetical protein V3V23_08295 [Dehalococcoidales bacterium]
MAIVTGGNGGIGKGITDGPTSKKGDIVVAARRDFAGAAIFLVRWAYGFVTEG